MNWRTGFHSLSVGLLLTCFQIGCFSAGALAAEVEEEKPKGVRPENVYAEIDDQYVELIQLFADTLDQVDRNYVKDVDRRELMEAAIRGVISKLDPYSNYIGPDELDRFKTGVESEFGGIGIQIGLRDEQLIVTSPMIDTPAFRAGVLAGDRITHINGEPTKGLSLEEAIKKLKGPIGSEVKVTIYHPADFSSEEVELRRENIQIETIIGDQRLEDGTWDFLLDHESKIGYIRMTAFSRMTAGQLRSVIESLLDQEMEGLVLDLRSNPGGLLGSAVEVCDMFIDSGKIVSTEGRNSPKRSWSASSQGTLPEFPMAVLIDGFSASASEIVSACLQDHDRAVVIGQRSWGKGSVQNIVELEAGKSALKLTTADYQRPSGKKIHRYEKDTEKDDWGVSPSDGFEVKLSRDQLIAYSRYRRTRDMQSLNPSPPAPETELAEIDPALAKALEYLREEISK